MDSLAYPFDGEWILKKKKSLRRELLAGRNVWTQKKIAILGGSTTEEIKNVLELFLLDNGIMPTFYESEYAQYWNDAMFGEELAAFMPELIFIHTSTRNILTFPQPSDSAETIEAMYGAELAHYTSMWDKLLSKYNCPVIQNNFERPPFRLLGNCDCTDMHGHTNYVQRLNMAMYDYCKEHNNFFVHDQDYVAASFGIEKYSSTLYWNMYKYSMCLSAVPYFVYNLANIIKAIFGGNKKALVLDLDNTLWGGVIGDDGVNGIVLGPETPMGQVYCEFQEYILLHKKLGVLLTIASKNDEKNALDGLAHPDSRLRAEDFVKIKANWNTKDENVAEIAEELAIGQDSLVFVDDNPAERAIVHRQLPHVVAPNIGRVENYMQTLDRAGFFEVINFSADDLQRSDMYRANAERTQQQKAFASYEEYLQSLDMEAVIRPFEPLYMQRIAQLTVKSNQFNLTTRRYTQAELEAIMQDDAYITLYGRLRDTFGDNGVVSLIVGKLEGESVHVHLWLMSCRVLKRQMENAMLDELVCAAREKGAQTLRGYYYPTEKNGMVKTLYEQLGFRLVLECEGASEWEYSLTQHAPQCSVIKIKEA